MNTAEFVTSLTPEQNIALLALRDELSTAASAHDAELGAAHLVALAAKDATIVDLQNTANTANTEKAALIAERDAAIRERDAQIGRTQQLAAMASELETAEDALNSQWEELRTRRKQIVEAANQGRKEQIAANLDAQEAEIARQRKSLGIA